MAQGIYASLTNTEYTDKVVAFVKGRKILKQQASEQSKKVVEK